MEPDQLFRFLDILGVVANALLGGAVARSKNFDAIGFLILAIISGMGGGMIRDALLNTMPIALTDPWYLPSAIIAALIALAVDTRGKWTNRLLLVADALVLGCWSATGASKALYVGLGVFPAIFLGVITAVGGSMLRDVLVNRVPGVFGGNPLYASISILGAGIMVVFQSHGLPLWGMSVSTFLCAMLAIMARWRRWTLPGATALTMPRPRIPAHLRDRTFYGKAAPRRRTRFPRKARRAGEPQIGQQEETRSEPQGETRSEPGEGSG